MRLVSFCIAVMVLGAVLPADAREADRGTAGRCPTLIPDTRVTAQEVPGGSALTFTTPSSNVPNVRERVNHLAAMFNRHPAGGLMTMRGGPSSGMLLSGLGTMNSDQVPGGMMMPGATASVEDIEDGSRLILRTDNRIQREELRLRATQMAARMEQGQCPAMSPLSD